MNQEKWKENNRRDLTIASMVVIGIAIVITAPVSFRKNRISRDLAKHEQKLEQVAEGMKNLDSWESRIAHLKQLEKITKRKQTFQDYKQLQAYLRGLTELQIDCSFSFSKDKSLTNEGYFLQGNLILTGPVTDVRNFIYKMMLSANTRNVDKIHMDGTGDGQVTAQLQAIFCLKEKE